MKKLLLITSMTLSLTGCGTLMTLDDSSPYSGVYKDLGAFEPCHGAGCMGLVIVRPLAIIDLPLSFVGDTLMLPVKGIQNLVQD